MVDRLSPQDVSFLYAETAATPLHVGGVAVLAPPEVGFDYERLVELIGQRIALVPRFRQRVKWVPGHLANPVWVDDEHFDLTYHVRRSALPRPGSEEQLRELVARLQSRRLDRTRPLWEAYLVEGLEGGRVALVTKTHGALVDGVAGVDLSTVLLDPDPTARPLPDDDWQPRHTPGTVRLLAGALADAALRPTAAVADSARTALLDARSTVERTVDTAAGVASSFRSVTRPGPTSALHVRTGPHRRFSTVATDLEDYRRVRAAHGGTVNDIVLATITGALRTWLMTRGEPVTPRTTVRAVVPVSVQPGAAPRRAPGSRVARYVVELPVGEGSPGVRLHQVRVAMRGHEESGRSVGAGTLVQLSGFAPPTLHALGVRAATGMTRRLSDLVVTNVPGPQVPMFAAGARLLQMYPVVPLAKGQAVSIGLTSYDGGVFYGLNADRDALPDVDVLGGCLVESLAELVETPRP